MIGQRVDIELLSQSALLRDLPPEELDRLAAAMRRRVFRRGEVVFHQGDPGETLHLVCSGHLKVVLPSETGDEALLKILGPGEVFGEMALLDGAPRSATVVALEVVETATLSRADFQALLRRSPAAVDGLLAVLAGMVRALNEEVGSLMFLDHPGRLAKKLLELAESHGRPANGRAVEIELPLTQDELAAMIGTSRQTVNKLLGMYEAQRAVARGNRSILILDPDLLRQRVVS